MSEEHVLVIDDYDDLRELIAFALMAEGYRVTEAATGQEGLDLIRETSPDLIILDIGLPDISGLEVCKAARETTDVPILMLTGDMSAETAAKTLDLGAADYLRKPVELVELTARIRAALRDAPAQKTPQCPTIEVGPLRVDTLREAATYAGKDIGLSGTEIRVLAHLMHNSGEIVSKQDFINQVWGEEREPHLIEVHVSAIRRKLESAGCGDDPIKTVRALGYRFVPPSS